MPIYQQETRIRIWAFDYSKKKRKWEDIEVYLLQWAALNYSYQKNKPIMEFVLSIIILAFDGLESY